MPKVRLPYREAQSYEQKRKHDKIGDPGGKGVGFPIFPLIGLDGLDALLNGIRVGHVVAQIFLVRARTPKTQGKKHRA